MTTTGGPEKFVVVWRNALGNLYSVTDHDRNPVTLTTHALKGQVHGVLSTEDEVLAATTDVRYAVPTALAHELFGWDV